MKKILLIIIAVFLSASVAMASNTYYIDYANGDDNNAGSKANPWQKSPGMPGFSGSYSHSVGDAFVFKGGVTWPNSSLPLSINYSGTQALQSMYTTDHTWFTGGSWSQPKFDGGGSGGTLVSATNRSYFTLNDIEIVGSGLPFVGNNYKAVNIFNSENYTISNCTINPESWIGLYLHSDRSGTWSNIRVEGNDISHTGQGIVVAAENSNVNIDGVDIVGNKIHDFYTRIIGGVHGDGIHTWGRSGDNSAGMTNLRIYNNSFFGNWEPSNYPSNGTTAFIFVEHRNHGAKIFNNTFTHDPASGVWITDGAIAIETKSNSGGEHEIYNNTISVSYPGTAYGIHLERNSPNSTVMNNIITGSKYGIIVSSASQSGFTSDYNNIYNVDNPGMWGGTRKSWSQWQALGHDPNGTNENPQLNSSLGLTSSTLTGTGHVRDGAAVLAGTEFELDKNGSSRGLKWDMGAYEFDNVSPSPPPLVW